MSRAEDHHIYKQLNPDEHDTRVHYSDRHTPAIFTKMKSAPDIKETVKERAEATEKEDKAIEYYLRVFEEHGLQAAQNAFWEVYK
jgi:predicted transcriptional regulator